MLFEVRDQTCRWCREEMGEDDRFLVELSEPECWTLLEGLSARIIEQEEGMSKTDGLPDDPNNYPVRMKYVLMYDQIAGIIGAKRWDDL
jgi:hypothetical protein